MFTMSTSMTALRARVATKSAQVRARTRTGDRVAQGGRADRETRRGTTRERAIVADPIHEARARRDRERDGTGERNTRERTDDGRNANATRTGTQDAGEELRGARREGGGRNSGRVLRAGRVLGGARVDALRDVGRTVVRDVHDVPGGATIGQELGRGGVPEDGEAGSGGGPGGEG